MINDFIRTLISDLVLSNEIDLDSSSCSTGYVETFVMHQYSKFPKFLAFPFVALTILIVIYYLLIHRKSYTSSTQQERLEFINRMRHCKLSPVNQYIGIYETLIKFSLTSFLFYDNK